MKLVSYLFLFVQFWIRLLYQDLSYCSMNSRSPPFTHIRSTYTLIHILWDCDMWRLRTYHAYEFRRNHTYKLTHYIYRHMQICKLLRHTHSAVKPKANTSPVTHFTYKRTHLSENIITHARKRHSDKCMCYKPRHRPHLEAGLTYHHLYSLLHKRRKFELEKRIYSFRTWTGVRLGQKSVHV